MKERPILFSGSMVQAILDGRKTQTRRIVKGACGAFWDHRGYHPEQCADRLFRFFDNDAEAAAMGSPEIKCPYGQALDRLWVRETWADLRGKGFDMPFAYGADTFPSSEGDRIRAAYGIKWKPSIHMPRAVSRITLEITGVRLERVQDITEDDAKAEGAELLSEDGSSGWGSYNTVGPSCYTHRWGFKNLWDLINSERGSWGLNPWVWVVGFKRDAEAAGAGRQTNLNEGEER